MSQTLLANYISKSLYLGQALLISVLNYFSPEGKQERKHPVKILQFSAAQQVH